MLFSSDLKHVALTESWISGMRFVRGQYEGDCRAQAPHSRHSHQSGTHGQPRNAPFPGTSRSQGARLTLPTLGTHILSSQSAVTPVTYVTLVTFTLNGCWRFGHDECAQKPFLLTTPLEPIDLVSRDVPPTAYQVGRRRSARGTRLTKLAQTPPG